MDLWQGSISQFVRGAESGALAGDMSGKFIKVHRYLPGMPEVRSWEHSLRALAAAVGSMGRASVGVSIRTNPLSAAGSVVREGIADAGVALEYHLPLSGKRVDVILTGHDRVGQGNAVVLELKQWSSAVLEDDVATNVTVAEHEHVHPSQQALDYAEFLANYHSGFTRGPLAAVPLSYCHEMTPAGASALRDPRFQSLLVHSPLFVAGEEGALCDFVRSHVGEGDGIRLLDHLAGAQFLPSQRVLDNLEAVLESREEWHLVDEQRLAFNAILDEVRRQQARAGRSVIVVRGAPGSGKTVVAVQLLAAALRLGWKAAHSTGGKAFTTALRSKFKGADELFIWNMGTRNAPSQALDLLLVDEAHRVRETSDNRFTPKIERGRRTQVEELTAASRVTVFLLDENQFVRPDEVGSTQLIRDHAVGRRSRFKEFDLATQFRCGGCSEYVQWVDHLLGYASSPPEPWGDRYSVELATSTRDLDRLMAEAREAGVAARLLAGFCWRWSDPRANGELVDDVVIGDWHRPWNRKAGDKQYKPADHPYTRWAETEEGEGQVGCIYSAQGFEFARAGVIWGGDLVWRAGAWVAQKSESHDRPVKASSHMLRLVRNAYRVLLTRGLTGVRLLVLDDETRNHVEESLRGFVE